jgi:hypothetical protein|tara:strand:+ start:93 stop:563 length:471 start_codon:yes stop_codon:yes gene_type:complete
MALSNKKYDTIHTKTGSAKDKLKDEFDNGYLTRISDIPDKEPALAALVYQVGLMQEELDYLRTEISSNKDKTTFPGFGTSSTTALAGDTTTISTAQANAITANTAKVSFEGGTSTTLSFGDLITVPPKVKGGKPTYNIVMTATKSGVSKSTTLTLT